MAFEQAIAIDEDYGRAYLALSKAYKRQGKGKESNAYLKKARNVEQLALRKELSRSAMPWATGTPVKGDS